MKTLHIEEPFWGAWKIYGWGGRIPGIGIAERVVKEAEDIKDHIYITVGKDPAVYHVSPVTVRSLARKHNSVREVRFGNRVLVIPQNELQKIEEPDICPVCGAAMKHDERPENDTNYSCTQCDHKEFRP